MKNLCPIVLTALLISITFVDCAAQWTPVYQDDDVQFFDATFPTDHTGYVAATDTGVAVVLHTGDGGLTWDKRYIDGWSFINRIAMIDSLRGYLIKGGGNAQILRTDDGFLTFTVHNIDASFGVFGLELLNDSTGFYLNNESRLRKFGQSGASFVSVIDTLSGGQNLQFVSPTIGYLDNGDRLLRTTDAGLSWHYVADDLGFYCWMFRFSDATNGYFGDGEAIHITHDGGLTFAQHYSFPSTSFAVQGNFCMAANADGNVAYTTDGGSLWATETTGINLIAPETYTVRCTPTGNCFLFSRFSGEIRKRSSLIAGITDPSSLRTVSIAPNPFSSTTTISFGQHQPNTRIRVTDVLGKEVATTTFTDTQFTFDRGTLVDGIYFLSIMDGNSTVASTKMIVR